MRRNGSTTSASRCTTDRAGGPATGPATGTSRKKKRIEESLRKSEQKFKAVFQGAIEAIYIHDQKGRFIDANPQAYQRLGYSKDELLTMTPVDIDIQAEKVEVRIEKLNREGFLSFETEFVRKDGSRFPVEVNSLVIEYGGRQAVLAVVRDISKRKRAENALREARNLFQSLVETTSDWIWEVDENFRYVYASPKITDILGYQPEEVLGKLPFDLMPRDEAARLKPLFEEIQGSCQPFKGLENRSVRKDGTEVILETSGVPFHKPDGKGCGFRGIDRDITERKQMEQSLWELNRDLENRVRRRTRELEQANNAKNEFLANMSHEIRTPLSGI
ncbi:MAG: PAS domain S-box protein, partial [Desulfovibrionales bacterium]